MRKRSICLIILSCLLSDPLIAQNAGIWVVSVGGGTVWTKAGKTQTLFLAPEIENTYAAKKSISSTGAGELFIGMEKVLSNILRGQLGLSGAVMGTARLGGEIWDDADPQFNNHRYHYRINHQHIAVQGKLLLNKETGFIPWISSGIGVSFNQAHEFSNKSLSCGVFPVPDFNANQQTALALTLGAGLQKILNRHWQIGGGYTLADWGKSRLGRAEGQSMNSGLKLNHLIAQGILFNLTYIG
ncbi:hypothetical protein Lqui_1284 [Legionella quinlivanii]|uniref:Outer membrane protein beta-barrel domain-containing protein n=2 Tax=Legionella quinlivanii TaxID=45073 RepID=A0A0W0XYU5_9GAMM|nr:hypothetical protein Lqui_1284 [Legionella quinlivanii]SEF96532.1 hypothetical protein SAMN02746093_01514 [Legionella quinlivanii DSM 21216]STY11265.1 Uncharacterised protein [Legionella quinlivanii]